MHTLDLMIIPPVLIGAAYYVVRTVFGKTHSKKACGCSGCGEAENCSEKSGTHNALSAEKQKK